MNNVPKRTPPAINICALTTEHSTCLCSLDISSRQASFSPANFTLSSGELPAAEHARYRSAGWRDEVKVWCPFSGGEVDLDVSGVSAGEIKCLSSSEIRKHRELKKKRGISCTLNPNPARSRGSATGDYSTETQQLYEGKNKLAPTLAPSTDKQVLQVIRGGDRLNLYLGYNQPGMHNRFRLELKTVY